MRGQQALFDERLRKLQEEFHKKTLEGTLLAKPEDKEQTLEMLRNLLGREPKENDFVNLKWSMANRKKIIEKHREYEMSKLDNMIQKSLREDSKSRSLERRKKIVNEPGFQSFD